MEDIDFKAHRKKLKKKCFKDDYGSSREDQTSVVGECPLHEHRDIVNERIGESRAVR